MATHKGVLTLNERILIRLLEQHVKYNNDILSLIRAAERHQRIRSPVKVVKVDYMGQIIQEWTKRNF